MKICIPTAAQEGLKSPIEPHFGEAPHLLVIDTTNQEIIQIDRENGSCQTSSGNPPPENIVVDTILCGSIGRHMLKQFQSQGIQVLATDAEDVEQALRQLASGQLPALDAGECCGGHGHAHGHGGCGSHEHEAEHECCGGHGHDDDHECCGGKNHGAGGCGCGH